LRASTGRSRGGVLLILVDVDPGAVFDAVEVFFGELAVFREARDAEVPGAVFGFVGDVLGGELFDECDHLRNAASGAGEVLGMLDVEGVEVFEEGTLVAGGVLGDGDAGGGGVADDLVVDVGDVHDVVDGDSLLADEAAEHVGVEEGARVPMWP
jgi:hypothetical protein